MILLKYSWYSWLQQQNSSMDINVHISRTFCPTHQWGTENTSTDTDPCVFWKLFLVSCPTGIIPYQRKPSFQSSPYVRLATSLQLGALNSALAAEAHLAVQNLWSKWLCIMGETVLKASPKRGTRSNQKQISCWQTTHEIFKYRRSKSLCISSLTSLF